MSRVDNIISGVRKSGTEKKKSRVDTIIEKSSKGNIQTGVDEKYINTFLDDARNYFSSVKTDYENIGYNNASSLYDNYSSKSTDLGTRAGRIRAYLNSNKSKLDEKTYTELISTLDNIDRDRDSISTQLRSNTEYFSQFKSEEEYNAEVSKYNFSQKYKDVDYSKIKSTIANLENEYNYFNHQGNEERKKAIGQEIEWLKNHSTSREVVDNMSIEDLNDMWKGNDEEISALQKEKQDINHKITFYNRGSRKDYKSYTEVEQAKERIKAIDSEIEKLSPQNKVFYYDEDGAAVTLQNLLSVKTTEQKLDNITNDATAKPIYDSLQDSQNDIDVLDKAISVAQMGYSSGGAMPRGYATATTYEHRQYFDYLAQKYGIDTNKMLPEFIEDLENLRNNKVNEYETLKNTFSSQGYDWDEIAYYNQWKEDKMMYQSRVEKAQKYGKEHPFMSTLANIVAAPSQIFDLVGNVADGTRASNSDYDSMYQVGNPFDDQNVIHIRESSSATGELINNKILESTDSEVLAWLGTTAYSGVTSVLQSASTAVACKALFGAAGEAISLGVLGSEAAASQYNTALMNGSTHGEALQSSIAAGAAEVLFEKLSLDHFFKMGKGIDASSLSALLKSVGINSKDLLVQGLLESSEELFTSISNRFTDDVINGDHSQYYTNINKLMAQGYSKEEATKLADKEYWMGLLGDVVGGFFGGFAGGSFNTGFSNISAVNQYNKNALNEGQRVLSQDGGVDALRTLAESVSGVKTIDGKQVDKLKGKVTNDTSRKNKKNVGKLSMALDAIRNQQNEADITNALVSKGMSMKEAKKSAEVLMVAANQGYFSDSQIEMLEKNPKMIEVLREVVGDGVDGQTSGSVSIRNTQHQLGRQGIRVAEDGTVNEDDLNNYKEKAVAQLSEANPNTSSPTTENLAESKFEISDDGKTTNIKTGNAVEIKKIESISESGEANLTVDDGDVVKASDIAFSSPVEALFIENIGAIKIGKKNIGIESANALYQAAMTAWKNNPDMTASEAMSLIKGLTESYFYGTYNLSRTKLTSRNEDGSAKLFAGELSQEQREFAYELGAKDSVSKADADQKVIDELKEKAKSNTIANKGRVRFEDGVVAKGKLQKRAVSLAKHLASAIGIDIVFYDSTKGGLGSDANGYFDEDTDTIYLDLQNSWDDAKTIAFTMSHELVHFIKKWSPKKYNTFAKFLMEQYAEHGVDSAQLLANKMVELKTKDADYAYEEMVCDACETMLLDSNAVYKLMELRKTDLELFDKIKLHIHELLNKIRNMYKKLGLDPTSDEAKALLGMQDILEQIYSLFEEATVDAAQSYQAVQNANETIFGEASIDVGKTESGIKNQLKNHKKIGEDATAYNDRHKNVHKAILQVGIESMYEMAETMLPYLEEEGILPPDIPGKTIFKNGSYGKTGENTTLCVRTLTYEDFKDRVAEEIGRPLTVSESLLVSQKIYDIATDPQCIYCYVAADRKAYDGYLGEYWKAMDKYIKALRKGGDSKALYTEYLAGRKDTAQQQKRWSQWEAIAKSGKDYISAKDLSTKRKRDVLIAKKNAFSEQIKDAQRYAQSASWAKTVFDYRAYKGDILKMTSKFVDMLNSEYGLRMYSFSDYTPAFIVENMQMIIDASVKGLKSLAYTKDTDYAEIFALTGQAINVSCFAKWDAELGTYVEDNRQGANWEKTKNLRKQYRNVGAVMVATNDAMVEWALKQDWVDVVIPYHIVKTGTTIANEYQWNNYTSESADRVGNKTANIYPTEHNNDFATYSNLLKERGITPRFSKWYDMVASGKLTEEQYMKLVNEVRLPASELSAVIPSFNLDAAKKSFGIDNEGKVIKGGFVDKGGYMGGWYREGVDVNQEVMAVSEDIKAGKSSLEVDYGMSKAAKEKAEAKYKKQEIKSSMSNSVFTEEEMLNIRKNVVNHFNLKGINGFEQVQKGVLNTLRANGFFDNNGEKKVVIKENGMEVTINRGSIEETFGNGNKYESIPATFKILKLATIEQIPNIIENANVIVENEKNKHDNGKNKTFTYLRGTATIEGKYVPVRITLKISKEKNKFWVHHVDVTKNTDDIFGLGAKNASPTDSKLSSAEDIVPQENAESQEKHIKKQLKKSQSSYAPTFYSQMGKVIEGVKQEKLAANSVVNLLRGKGVKGEEIRWSGIVPFLEGKKSVTKQELLDFINSSMLQIGEEMSDANFVEIAKQGNNYIIRNKEDGTILDTFYKIGRNSWENDSADYVESFQEIKDFALREYGGTRWSQYKLDGGENYREIVFTMPNSSYSNNMMRVHWGEDAEGVLVHARIQDFEVNGKKMLFIEEIQSDYHNEGHKDGYRDDSQFKELQELEAKANETFYALEDYSTELTGLAGEYKAVAKTQKGRELLRAKIKAEKELKQAQAKFDSKIPDAPFKENYHEYVLKRLLRMAAEEGYDSIGWTPSEIQSDRWSDEFAEGYRIEYDQEMPKFLRKYGRQWGATVGKTAIAKETVDGRERILKETELENVKRDIESEKRDLARHHDSYERARIQMSIDSMEKTVATLEKELSASLDIWSMDITDSMKNSVLYEGQAQFQKKTASNRAILANSLEGAAQNDIERNKLNQYKEKISLIEAEEKRLSEIQKQLFTKDAVDPAERKKLQFEAKQISNRINTYDRQLLNLEATTALKNVLNREKALAQKRQKQIDAEILKGYKEKAAKTTRELMERHQESRRKATESRNKTAMRHKIKSVVSELNTLLTHGNKKNHVPEDLKVAVAEVLELFNMDTVGAEERIAKLKVDLMKAKTPEQIQEISRKIDNIQTMGDRVNSKLKKLKSAYDTIKTSADPEIAGGFDEVISNRIEYVASIVGKTPLRYMTLEQLEAVYSIYTMVLNNIREANSLFKKDKAETVENYASRVIGEVKQAGGEHEFTSPRTKGIKEFIWNNLKPIFAFEKIGSKTLTDLYEDVRIGEDTWAIDVTEAKSFVDSKYEKYNYKKWDLDKKYNFKSTTGEQFSLTLEQILSLYAYSKRPQAGDHLRIGGFVFDDSITTYKEKENGKKSILKYNVNIAKAHQISIDTLANIVSSLTSEQKAFVDEMQTYLSDVMGAKGNEVSMTLYNVRLFKEKNYFPLKSAKQFMFEQNEVAGEVKIKNSGFTESTVEHANNPIILNNFMDVWANHVNDMAMYHSFVVPLENFNRVFNYQTRRAVGMPAVSVKETLQTAYGTHAVSYIRQLLTDLNGGARSDPRESTTKKLISRFKKAKVFSSASVVIQQPSAVARALALVDAKYFDFNPKLIKHKERWEELKKYAPVTIIKEMGHFDTDIGLSTAEYIKGQKTFMQKVDDVLSKAPSYADELTWVHIWEAVKRETKANHTDLKVGSEEFLKAAGKRFTEVITKTQVYDSVLSKSANMRSKSVGMSMMTAFMAEPTTSINMVEHGLRMWNRGYKKTALKHLYGVGASVILNAALVSLVYAMRDDDEDENYLEKYLGSFVSEIADGVNPLTYYPIVKDAWSLMQGYSVERTDMALISDAIDALKGIVESGASYDEDMTDDEMKKFTDDMVDSSLKLVDGIAALFGLSVGNIRRDVDAIINTIKTAQNGFSTSGLSLKNELVESVKDITPGWGWFPDEQKTDKLYEAIINEDATYIERLKSGYKDDKAYETAIRKALRENDPRIKEAAEAKFNGDFDEYERLFDKIEDEGNFELDTIKSAINAEFNKLNDSNEDETSDDGADEDKAESIYNTSDINVAFENGDTSSALEIIDDIVKVKTENYINDGETEKDAEKKAKSSVKSSMTSYWKPLYIEAYKSGNSNEMTRIRKILLSSGLYGRANDVVKTGQDWIKNSKK